MRRIRLVFAAAAVMVAMLVVVPGSAMAQDFDGDGLDDFTLEEIFFEEELLDDACIGVLTVEEDGFGCLGVGDGIAFDDLETLDEDEIEDEEETLFNHLF